MYESDPVSFIAGCLAAVLIVVAIVVGVVEANDVYNHEKTKQMQVCLSSGGHWDQDGCHS